MSLERGNHLINRFTERYRLAATNHPEIGPFAETLGQIFEEWVQKLQDRSWDDHLKTRSKADLDFLIKRTKKEIKDLRAVVARSLPLTASSTASVHSAGFAPSLGVLTYLDR